MKNNIKILTVIFISLILLACGKKTPEEPKMADDEVVINNKLYKLNKEESGYGISYKIDSNFVFRDTGNSLSYYAPKNEDGSSDFVIRLFHYKNKSLEYAIKDTVEKYDTKTEEEINGLKYTKVHFVNYNNANTYLYYHIYKKDVYVFCFTAWHEEVRLEDIFLNRVIYPENVK